MFINSKKSFEICEGEKKFIIPRDFIGEVPAWVAKHWLVLAAIKDGSIATPKARKDKALEQAGEEAEVKADAADKRKE
ncbi:hypothetical protein [Lacrimispora indolis]|uniref:hypothetical protein n=1 Tax=Lacrimispora indolis TaxID=69825 RepID=UPI00042A52CA|nr:hypothetical protein [[Clostridium] methoxybenzovorans]